jgi:hypothetical protein
MKEWEIWVGNYNLGQGYDPSTEPQLIGKETASTFKIACFIHELKSKLHSVVDTDRMGRYVSDQDFEWFYNPRTNSCAWLGRFFETKEEAQTTFR